MIRGLPSFLNERYFDDPHSVDFAAVIDGVTQNDALCLDALKTWRTELSCFLVSVVRMYAPEIIILSGGAASAAPYFLDDVRKHVNQHTFRYPPGEDILIEVSDIANYSVVLVAAAMAWGQSAHQAVPIILSSISREH